MLRNTTAVPVAALWDATRMVMDMYCARGYQYEEHRFQTDRQLFTEYVRHTADLSRLQITAIDQKGRKVCACFIPDKQFKKEQATKLTARLTADKVHRLVLIWSQAGSAPATASLKQAFALETWTYAQAQSHFHRHMGVPVQRKLTKKERLTFFDKYRLTPTLMGSCMYATTAMAKFMGVQSGDIVHVWRVTNEGVSRAYRYVK
jgi:DNA-directed RNA polymerase subunit H (RpoH/RPB5)